MSSFANALEARSVVADAIRDSTLFGAQLPMSLLQGMTVLLVEDEFLIALEASALLTEAGASEVITARTTAEASAAIAGSSIGLAVLDINLSTEQSIAVADALTALKIPFVFATGYADTAMLPAHHRAVPVVRKPYGNDDLLAAVAAAVAAAPRSRGGTPPADDATDY